MSVWLTKYIGFSFQAQEMIGRIQTLLNRSVLHKMLFVSRLFILNHWIMVPILPQLTFVSLIQINTQMGGKKTETTVIKVR